MGKHVVTIGDKQYEVDVSQQSMTVWRAFGQFDGRYLEVKGRSATQALQNWRRVAAADHGRR
jgi:hypothetical protein